MSRGCVSGRGLQDVRLPGKAALCLLRAGHPGRSVPAKPERWLAAGNLVRLRPADEGRAMRGPCGEGRGLMRGADQCGAQTSEARTSGTEDQRSKPVPVMRPQPLLCVSCGPEGQTCQRNPCTWMRMAGERAEADGQGEQWSGVRGVRARRA